MPLRSTRAAGSNWGIVRSSIPAITLLTSTLSAISPATAVLSASVAGTTPISYKWLRGASTVSSGTINAPQTLTFTLSSGTTSGTYTLSASNSVGQVQSANIQFDVYYSPTITRQPTGAGNYSSAQTLTVSASGSGSVSYQWYKDNASLGSSNGAQTASLSGILSNGSYKAVATSQYGTVSSNAVSLTFNPVILAQPASVTVAANTSSTFTVSAGGTGTPSYQWYANGASLGSANGAQTATLTYSAAATVSIFCRVSNANGYTDTSTVSYAMGTAPQVSVTWPSSIVNGTALTVNATAGTYPLTYTWVMPNNLGPTYLEPAVRTITVSSASDSFVPYSYVSFGSKVGLTQWGGYGIYCTVSNAYGSASTSRGLIDLQYPPAFVSSSPSDGASVHLPFTLTVNFGAIPSITSYVWRKGGTWVDTGASNSITFNSLSELTDMGGGKKGTYMYAHNSLGDSTNTYFAFNVT